MVCGRALQHLFPSWAGSCAGPATEGWLGEPHPYSLAAAMSQMGEGGQEGEICLIFFSALNNSPRALCVSPALFFPADECSADDASGAALGPLAASCAADIRGAHTTGTAPLCCPPSLLQLPGPLGAQHSLRWALGSCRWDFQLVFLRQFFVGNTHVEFFLYLLPCPSGGRACFALCSFGSGFPLEILE